MGNYIMDLRKSIGHQTLLMPSACVIIGNQNGGILLQQREDDGKWSHHGGAIELDEKVEDAAKRELKEELNIKAKELEFLGIYSGKNYHHIYPNGDEVSCIDIVYVCQKFYGNISFEDGEVIKAKWFEPGEIPANISDNARQPIKDYYKKYFGINL